MLGYVKSFSRFLGLRGKVGIGEYANECGVGMLSGGRYVRKARDAWPEPVYT